jgi:spore coat polysaccharide biosynthesis protein SpsF
MIGVVVQARMSSTRLPGKVLQPLAGRPVLSYLLERLARARTPDETIVATSDEPEDDPIARLAGELGVHVHRGPLLDVAGRFGQVAERFELFRAGDWELVTNVFPRSFPVGQSVEVLARGALERVLADTAGDADAREHVTRHIYFNPAGFRIQNFRHERDESAVRLAVDSREDLLRIERIVTAMDSPQVEYGLAELLRLERQSSANVG